MNNYTLKVRDTRTSDRFSHGHYLGGMTFQAEDDAAVLQQVVRIFRNDDKYCEIVKTGQGAVLEVAGVCVVTAIAEESR